MQIINYSNYIHWLIDLIYSQCYDIQLAAIKGCVWYAQPLHKSTRLDTGVNAKSFVFYITKALRNWLKKKKYK